jgi:hypothetical protein
MSDERKIVSRTLNACSNDWGHGRITGKFEAERYPGEPRLLDTRVELEIAPFSITWDAKEKLMAELEELLAKYQI